MKQRNSDCRSLFLKKCICLFGFVFLLSAASHGQDKPPIQFGKVSKEDFHIQSPLVDSNANAVVVFDKGDIGFDGNQRGWFMYVFKRTKRILILNNKGIESATVELLLYKNEHIKENVEDLNATTYNIENGSVIETKLNSEDVFEDKVDYNHFYKKFTMPAVKKGSIIEYSYTIKSDFTFNLPDWEFQSLYYPVLWSECNVVFPGLLTYMTFFQGYHKYIIDQNKEGFKTYRILRSPSSIASIAGEPDDLISVSGPITIRRWVMKDLPSFKNESYLTSPNNYMDKISFQLYKTYDGETSHDVANSWGKVSEELMKREDFGIPIKGRNYCLDNVLNTIVNKNDPVVVKARKIYSYIQKNFVCINGYNKFIKTDLQDVISKRSGTVGDINLLLIAMLKHENIDASPVLLSTTDFGRNSINYPQMEMINYIVAKFRNESTDYFLDATIPFLPFGKLPLKCYNGHARLIGQDTSAVFFTPEMITEDKAVTVFISNGVHNEMTGRYSNSMGFFESLETAKLPKHLLNLFKQILFPVIRKESYLVILIWILLQIQNRL